MRVHPPAETREALADRFFAAIGDGDVDGLMELLADDVVMVGDGGGRGAVRTPVVGRLRIARFLVGLGRYATGRRLSVERASVNGQPGIVAYGPDGVVETVLTIDVLEGKVSAIRGVVNPEKLRHLAPLRDGR